MHTDPRSISRRVLATLSSSMLVALTVVGWSCVPEHATEAASWELQIDAAISENAHVIDSLPDEAGGPALLAELEALYRNGSGDEDEFGFVNHVATRYPDSNLGLFAVDMACSKYENDHRPEDVVRFCRKIQTALPETPVQRFALSRELELLSATGGEVFDRRCDDLIYRGTNSWDRARAFYERAQYRSSESSDIGAGLDLIAALATDEKAVKKWLSEDTICARLESAGLWLEAALLEESEFCRDMAALLYSALDSSGVSRDAEPVPQAELNGQILLLAAQSDARLVSDPEASCSVPVVSIYAKASSSYRALMEALLRPDEVYQQYTAHFKTLMGDIGADEVACRVHLARANNQILDALASNSDERAGAPTELERLQLGFLQESAKLAATLDSSQLSAVTNVMLAFCRPRSLHTEVVRSLESIATETKEVAIARVFHLKAAEYERVHISEFVARSRYQQIAERYGDAKEAVLARLQLAVGAFQRGNYEQTASYLSNCAAESVSMESKALADTLLAACDVSLGFDEEAEYRLIATIEKYPQSSIAPYILFWLSQQKLRRNDLEGTESILQELTARYPESQEAEQAHLSLSKLASTR